MPLPQVLEGLMKETDMKANNMVLQNEVLTVWSNTYMYKVLCKPEAAAITLYETTYIILWFHFLMWNFMHLSY